MTGPRWTRKTLRKFTRCLRRKFKVGHTTIAPWLRLQRYALRANRKRLSRHHDPERNGKMRYIARQRRKFLKAGWPAISVDTKKKELIGAFKNAGRTWRQVPLDVLTTDFLQDAVGKAVPYGIYDLARKEGYVVGRSHETAAFAVAAVRSWWLEVGRQAYPGCHDLLIEADSGGANGYRNWLWKVGLQALADEFELTITVTHYPTSASKQQPQNSPTRFKSRHARESNV